jgi:hypothetical protein
MTPLTAEDINSRTWERVRAHLLERIEQLRVENDSFSDHDTTTKRRGRIAELKELLTLGNQAQLRGDGQ